MQTQLLQRERAIRDEGKKLTSKMRDVRYLTTGGTWTQVRDAWLAFRYLYDRLPLGAVIQTFQEMNSKCYDTSSWRHTPPGVPAPYDGIEDPWALLDWARQGTYYPAASGLAYAMLSKVLSDMSLVAATEALSIQIRVDKAKKEADELQQQGWDRLKLK